MDNNYAIPVYNDGFGPAAAYPVVWRFLEVQFYWIQYVAMGWHWSTVVDFLAYTPYLSRYILRNPMCHDNVFFVNLSFVPKILSIKHGDMFMWPL